MCAVKPPISALDASVLLDVGRELLYSSESIEDDDARVAAACLALLPDDRRDEGDARTTLQHLTALRALADLGLLVRPMELLQSAPAAVVRATAEEMQPGEWAAVVAVGESLGMAWEEAAIEVVQKLEGRTGPSAGAIQDAEVCVDDCVCVVDDGTVRISCLVGRVGPTPRVVVLFITHYHICSPNPHRKIQLHNHS